MAMAAAMLGGSAISAIGGFMASDEMAEALKMQARVQREVLTFNRERWQHYVDTYGDLEQMNVADAMEGVQGDFAGVTGRAAADVESQFANEQDRQRRDMMRYGLDPSSGRFASTDRELGMDRALTSASMQNTARETERRWAEDATRGLRLQVGNFGVQMRENAADGVTQAGNNLATAYGNTASNYGNMANNLFMQAGQMGIYGALSLAPQQAPAAGTQGSLYSGTPQPSSNPGNIYDRTMDFSTDLYKPSASPSPWGNSGLLMTPMDQYGSFKP